MHRIKEFLLDTNKKFCFDVDDILLNTTDNWMNLINKDKYFTRILKSRKMYPLKTKDIMNWNYMHDLLGDEVFKFHYSGEIYDNYKLVNYSLEVIDFLVNNIGFERLLFITASGGVNEELKDDILLKNFNIPKENIIHTNDKFKYYQSNFFIDDASHNHTNLTHREDTINCVLNYSWNSDLNCHSKNRIDCLSELLEILKVSI